jgi:hypothetical protein
MHLKSRIDYFCCHYEVEAQVGLLTIAVALQPRTTDKPTTAISSARAKRDNESVVEREIRQGLA